MFSCFLVVGQFESTCTCFSKEAACIVISIRRLAERNLPNLNLLAFIEISQSLRSFEMTMQGCMSRLKDGISSN